MKAAFVVTAPCPSIGSCIFPSSITSLTNRHRYNPRNTSFIPTSKIHHRNISTLSSNSNGVSPSMPKASAQQSSSTSPTSSIITPIISLGQSTIHTLFSLCVILGLQSVVTKTLIYFNFVFPAPLATMLILLFTISTCRLLGLSSTIDKVIPFFFTPAVTFLSRWLAVFFVPNLVMLPLAPSLPAADLSKIALFVPLAFAFTLFTTALVCVLLRFINSSSAVSSPKTVVNKSITGGGGPSNILLGLLGSICMITLGICKVTASVTSIPARIFTLCATLLSICIGQRLPSKLKLILHPLVVCTTLTLILIKLLSIATPFSFITTLTAYYPRLATSTALSGAGNLLSFLLGPAVITFAFTVDKHRKLALSRLPEVIVSSFFASITSLFGTAFIAKLLGLGMKSRLLLIPRTVTAPLAIPIAGLLGADIRLAASVVALTGLIAANIGRILLSCFKFKDPVVRGLAMGASGHGLGTAAMSEESEALPFSALAMTLVGVFSTILVAISPLRACLINVALGPLGRELLQEALL